MVDNLEIIAKFGFFVNGHNPCTLNILLMVYNQIMRIKFALLLLMSIAIVGMAGPGVASAEDAATIFTQQTNPHAVCKWYRDNGFVVERESDNECLISVGTGEFKGYTQFYYSGNNWCYKLTQGGQTFHENCIPIPESTVSASITDENTPILIVGGIIVFGMLIAAGASSSAAKARALKASEQTSLQESVTSTTEIPDATRPATPNLKPIRSGKTSTYSWEEMETGNTDTGEDMTKGPGEGVSQGGVGITHGEPIVKPVASEIERLVKLRNDGSITQREFNLAKKKLLK